MSTTRVLLDHLVFPEGPRWHDGRLWFSDVHAGKVMSVDTEGHARTEVEVSTHPSGLGWLPGGELLIVSSDRRLLKWSNRQLSVVADLTSLASYTTNDMVVDAQGRAYIGNYGFDLGATPLTPRMAEVILVTPDGNARVVANEFWFPNGSVITPDGRTLIVAETFAARLTAFDIQNDGSLTNRRPWALFDDLGVQWAPDRISPDGICLDAEGAIWVASPRTNETIRVREGGEIIDRITATQRPYACMLGGADRRTLFICTAQTHMPVPALKASSGRIETIEVKVPGAGLP